jgi:hypothetical protein
MTSLLELKQRRNTLEETKQTAEKQIVQLNLQIDERLKAETMEHVQQYVGKYYKRITSSNVYNYIHVLSLCDKENCICETLDIKDNDFVWFNKKVTVYTRWVTWDDVNEISVDEYNKALANAKKLLQ